MKLFDFGWLPVSDKDHIYRYWPIRIGWKRSSCHALISFHGWQVGWKDTTRVYGWTAHLGALKFMFGPLT